MPKLTFRVILPLMQLAIAVGLLRASEVAPVPQFYVPTARLICWGLNAPAVLLSRAFDPHTWGLTWDWLPNFVFGVDRGDLLFLMGVGAVWYLIGCKADRGRHLEDLTRVTVRGVLANFAVLAIGSLLGIWGWHLLGYPLANNPNEAIMAALTFAWSAGLVVVGARGLIHAIRVLRT